MLTCESFFNLSGTVESILLFGNVHKVFPYTEKAAAEAIKKGMFYYCETIDKAGNKYKLFSDWDPCLPIAKTVAFKI